MKAPTRLIDDPTAAAELRSDLQRAGTVSPAYDAAAGLAGLQAAMTATSAATGTGASASASASATSSAAAKTSVVAAGKSASVLGVLSIKAVVATFIAAAAVTSAIAWTNLRPARRASTAKRAIAHAPNAARAPDTVAAPSPVPTETPAVGSPTVQSPAATLPAVVPHAATEAAPDAARSQDAASRREIAQLARIKAVVDTDPARAYQLAQQGDREFARGMLRQEREALAIVALAHSGRKSEAARRTRAFLARYPNSPARERLEQLLGAQRP